MTVLRSTVLVSLAIAASAAAQSRVLVLSSGDPALDNTVLSTLSAQGLVPTLGPEFYQFTSAVNLASTDVVYFQANNNWNAGAMPLNGQQHLLDFITTGGGLVTCEWVAYLAGAGNLTVLGPSFPVTNNSYTSALTVTYSVATPHLVMTGGLPSAFEMNLTNYSGMESGLTPKPGSTLFLTSGNWTSPSNGGVVGSTWGSGRVVSFSTTNGPAQFDSAPFRRLLANAIRWADALPSNCYPDCNNDGLINLADFGCFQTKFALGDPYADCNGDSVRNLSDFGCFQTKFALGCP